MSEIQMSIFDEEIISILEEPHDNKDYEERVKNAFKELLVFSKKRNNPSFISSKGLPVKIRNYVLDFKKNGWIDTEKSMLQIKEEYINFHTVEELIDDYQISIKSLLSKPNLCWYKDFLQLRNFSGPRRFKNKSDKDRFYNEKSKITKEVALQLGLNHFINVPSSRGHKMSAISSKWARKYVIPTLAKYVIPITDIDKMESFFKNHTFFFGRRDWDWEGLSNIPAYPTFKAFSPTEFELACLTQVEDENTLKMIFDYLGYATGSGLLENRRIVFPEGWSIERYEESLTEEDKELIGLDKERLKRLHA